MKVIGSQRERKMLGAGGGGLGVGGQMGKNKENMRELGGGKRGKYKDRDSITGCLRDHTHL